MSNLDDEVDQWVLGEVARHIMEAFCRYSLHWENLSDMSYISPLAGMWERLLI